MPDSSEDPPQKKYSTLNAVKNYYDKYATQYDADYEEATWRLYDDLTWYFIEPYLPDDKSRPILDIGGGTAKWAIKLAEMGYHVICGDISQGMLDVAKGKIEERGLSEMISLQILDIRNMDSLENESFDLVLAVGDVISYALDDDLAVSECFRVCRPGGCCIASVDNKLTYIVNEIYYNHIDRIEEFMRTGISNFFKHHPVKAYFPQNLQLLFENHGFIMEKIAGKPVLTVMASKKERKQKLEPNYDLILKLEKQLADDPAFIGHGGHLQIIAKKPQ